MKVYYDLHIHSCLSPCAQDDMTPATIVGFAKIAGLDFVAVSDHNCISNVPAALEAGKHYGITVIPAMELQTSEDIHVLCLFKTYEQLSNFYNMISFTTMPNRKEIFGNQYIMDADDNIVGEHPYYLLSASDISVDDVPARAKSFGGVAVLAHIDRESNGAVAILGDVPKGYSAVELSPNAGETDRRMYEGRYTVVCDSDSHTLEAIAKVNCFDLQDNTIDALFAYLEKPR